MTRIKCIDTNGRKFSLMLDSKMLADIGGEVTQEWIDSQNALRASALKRAAIVEWEVETL